MFNGFLVKAASMAALSGLLMAAPLAHADYDTDNESEARKKFVVVDGKRLQDGIGIVVGATAAGGNSEFASTNLDLAPLSQGIVIRDRNGMTSRMVFGLIVAVGGALAASGPKSVSSTTTDHGDYRVTTTTTTYYSEAEKAAIRENTNSAIDGLFSTRHSDFELALYSRDRFGFGDTSGYKLNFYLGTGDSIVFETGFGFGSASSIVNRGGMPVTVNYEYVGMPFRASTTVGPLRAAATYEWNWSKYGIENDERQLRTEEDGSLVTTTASHPWKLELSAIVLGRVALAGGVTWQQIQKYDVVGYHASAGLAF